MTIDAPCREDAFRESIFTGTPDVIHDFVTTIFDDRFTDSRREIIEDCIPTHLLPISCAAVADPFQRIEYSIRIIDLIQRRRTFRTVAPARSRVLRIALELLNLICIFVDVSEQPA